MSMSMCVSVRTGVACVWPRAVCSSVCVWNVLSVCVMRLVCRPGVSMKILNTLGGYKNWLHFRHKDRSGCGLGKPGKDG